MWRKTLVCLVVLIGLLALSPANSNAFWNWNDKWDLASIQYPESLQTVPFDPIKLVVQLEEGADPKTFRAWLNGKIITDAFEYDDLKHKMIAVVGKEDGLKFKRKKGRWDRGWGDRNVLKTMVKGYAKSWKSWKKNKKHKSTDVDIRQFYALDGSSLTCSDLASLALPDVTVNSVQEVAATASIPEHCRILGTIDDEIGFEVRLPKDWNGKFFMGGGGGFVGSIQSQGWEDAIARGYATTGTDSGHKGAHGIDGSPFLNNPERIINWAHRAIHMTAVHAKLIVRIFYDSSIDYAYFNGCSTGGRQAMMESQRYPKDFDGIVVGAPAYRFGPDLISYIQQAMFPPGQPLNQPVLPNAKLPLISQAVLDNCDAVDGVVDGLIEDPRNCTFNHWDLQCPGDDDPGDNSCLTSAELEVLDRIYGDFVYSNGDSYPGYPVGFESAPGGWDSWITYSPIMSFYYGIPNLQYGFQQDILRYMVYNDPDFDFHDYDPLNAYDDERLLALYDVARAVNPDLSTFVEKGGKMIMWNGWADPILSALGTIVYYEEVESLDPNLRDYLRLFLLPGVLHCGGGPGPGVADFLSALEDWVEDGMAPESILAAHYTGGAVDRTRPLCVYPKVAHWTGSGSIDDAANFKCVHPDLTNINSAFMVTPDEAHAWHVVKDSGPNFAGSPAWKQTLDFLESKFKEYGVVDIVKNAWTYERWFTSEWPDDSKWSLSIEGTPVPISNYGAYSGSTDEAGITAPLVYYDPASPPLSVAGKIVVYRTAPHPDPPYSNSYKLMYTNNDYEYLANPETYPDDLFVRTPVSTSVAGDIWYQLRQTASLISIITSGGAAGGIMVFDMPYDRLAGLYTFGVPKLYNVPTLFVDRTAGAQVIADAMAGKTATLRLVATLEDSETHQIIGYLPGRNYGTPDDEVIMIRTHTDGPAIAQDNGAFGILGVIKYFSNIPQAERPRTLMIYLDCRHYMPGMETEFAAQDYFSLNPAAWDPVIGVVGIEHLGQIQFREVGDVFEPTGLVEDSFLWATRNQLLIDKAIQAVKYNGLPRVAVQCTTRPGIHGQMQGVWYGMGAIANSRGLPGFATMGSQGAYWSTNSHIDMFEPFQFCTQVATMSQLTGELMLVDLEAAATQ